jgi:hypothetical protein
MRRADVTRSRYLKLLAPPAVRQPRGPALYVRATIRRLRSIEKIDGCGLLRLLRDWPTIGQPTSSSEVRVGDAVLLLCLRTRGHPS